jgi:hypothetical protein
VAAIPARQELSAPTPSRIVTASQLAHYPRRYQVLGLLRFARLNSARTLAFEIHDEVALGQPLQLHKVSEYLRIYRLWTGPWVVLAAAFLGGDALSVDFSSGSG